MVGCSSSCPQAGNGASFELPQKALSVSFENSSDPPCSEVKRVFYRSWVAWAEQLPKAFQQIPPPQKRKRTCSTRECMGKGKKFVPSRSVTKWKRPATGKEKSSKRPPGKGNRLDADRSACWELQNISPSSSSREVRMKVPTFFRSLF